MSSGDFPGGPVTKTPHAQCKGSRFYPWSEYYIPYAPPKCSHVATKDPSYLKEDPWQQKTKTKTKTKTNKKQKPLSMVVDLSYQIFISDQDLKIFSEYKRTSHW